MIIHRVSDDCGVEWSDTALLPADFDAIEELHGGLGALKLPPPQPTSHEYGAYLRQQRQQRETSESLTSLTQPCVLNTLKVVELG